MIILPPGVGKDTVQWQYVRFLIRIPFDSLLMGKPWVNIVLKSCYLYVELNQLLMHDFGLPVPSSPLGTSLLAWWRGHEAVFPRLAKVARRFLSCQATSAASERVFSRGGGIATKTRNRLSGSTLHMLTFLKDNKDLMKSYVRGEA